MRFRLAPLLLLFLIAPAIHAQKRSGVLGNTCTGVVVSANEATREITISYPDEKTTGTFTGILEQGYKQKLKDGTLQELQLSELKPTVRVRVFYKDKTELAGGKKVKVSYIYRVDFLGRDEYTKLREMLNLPPSIPVQRLDNAKLPLAVPLKLYLAIQEPYVKQRIVKWIAQWNKYDGKKYGQIETVDDLAQADLSAVFFWGTDEGAFLMPFIMVDGVGTEMDIYQATVQLVTKDNDGLKILWLRVAGESAKKVDWEKEGPIEKELAVRMKARAKK